MAIKIITGPATEPLSVQEAADYLRINDNTDPILPGLIRSAREYCEDYQGKKFITQTLELILDRFPCEREIEFKNCSPIQSVSSVKYYDTTGTEHVLDSSSYIVDIDSFVNRIALKYGKQWPTMQLQPINAVRIQFIAGYGTASNVPENVKQAMVLHMKILYDDYKPDEREKLEKARDALLGLRRVIPV